MESEVIIQRIEKLKHQIIQLQKQLNGQNQIISEVKDQVHTDSYSMYLGDCVPVVAGLENDSIHYSIFSPPFLSLYVYSDELEDMGNSKTDDEFYHHFSYLILQLYRVLKPGRLITVHSSLVPMTIGKDGVIGLKDFPGQLVRLFEKHGFTYHSKTVIWKDPLIQAVRTKMLSLAHKQIVKDSSRCNQGFADELLTFRKPGENLEHIAHPNGFESYVGQDPEPKFKKDSDPAKNKYSHHVWQRYASPVWMDIDQGDTLNFRNARADNDERHICPLQLQVIARCLELWTNPGDVVLSPFAGIGSEGYESLKRNRKFIGVELKESYFKESVRNLTKAIKELKPIL